MPKKSTNEAVSDMSDEIRGGSISLSSSAEPEQRYSASAPTTFDETSSHRERCSVESIFPLCTVQALLDGFFTYLYPISPFPHEKSFRNAWAMREDARSDPFLALLSSMLGAFISTFPRQARTIIEISGINLETHNVNSDIAKCRYVCNVARGSGLASSNESRTQEAATSLYLALMHMNVQKWQICQIYLSQCFSILGSMHMQDHDSDTRSSSASKTSYLTSDGDEPAFALSVENTGRIDHIETQVGRRIFWRAFGHATTLEQLGVTSAACVVPLTTLESLHPPLPDIVDDVDLGNPHRNDQQSAGLSIMAGFNAIVETYRVYNAAARRQRSWHARYELWSNETEQRIWSDALDENKYAYAKLPDQLKHTHKIAAGFTTNDHKNRNTRSKFQERRLLQYELQKHILFVSILSVRSSIVEKLLRCTHSAGFNLTRDGCVLDILVTEKKMLVHDLSCGLRDLPTDIVEANVDLLVSCGHLSWITGS